ncbi:hypothetical protein ACWEOW_23920 [Monashia sp. NPDC004114]
MTADRELSSMAWQDEVPAFCTLSAAEQPVRLLEFDELFARDVRAVHAEAPDRLRFDLRAGPEVAARAAALAVKEAGCCSFFAFDLAIADGTVSLAVTAPAAHQDVLAALRARAESQMVAQA